MTNSSYLWWWEAVTCVDDQLWTPTVTGDHWCLRCDHWRNWSLVTGHTLSLVPGYQYQECHYVTILMSSQHTFIWKDFSLCTCLQTYWQSYCLQSKRGLGKTIIYKDLYFGSRGFIGLPVIYILNTLNSLSLKLTTKKDNKKKEIYFETLVLL